MPNAASRPKWNPWIALGGAAVLVALAFGLYGPPEPPPITNLSVKPLAPKKGKGFKATFTAGGPIKYRLYVLDRIDNRYILIRGSADGQTTTPRIGASRFTSWLRRFETASRRLCPRRATTMTPLTCFTNGTASETTDVGGESITTKS